jgi:hypothetical protein
MVSKEMESLGFLLGEWDLEYHIPKSQLADAGTDTGIGRFSRFLDDCYVVFDYSTTTGSAAHGLFAWDRKAGVLKYWWFENSGSFLSASCLFLDDGVLAMNWHDTVLVQTFTRADPDKILLHMSAPTPPGSYELVLEVVMTRKRGEQMNVVPPGL